MTKLLTFYNETFSTGLDYINEIWNVAKQDTSINGLYLCLPEYVKEGYLGISSTPNTLTWYNMLADGNYLYGNSLVRVNNSSQFNDKPCIQFADAGNTRLTYKFPVNVGTLIMVYLVRVAGSYIVYAPRSTGINPPIYYDAFPAGGSNLWANESLTGGSVYNAQSRINGKEVAPNVFVPLNSARILSVKDIANVDGYESISGYGGQVGLPGGAEFQGGNNSLKGSLAAIITYEQSISDELLEEIEITLGQFYIQYNGIVQSTTPTLKYLVDSSISYDFSTVFVDEWFDIINYEILSPLDLGLTFTGSVLSGLPTVPYEGDLVISVTNSANMTKEFIFDLLLCRAYPLVGDLPSLSTLQMVLSANRHGDGAYYGLKLDIANQVIYWEDARRLDNTIPIYKYDAVENSPCLYEDNTTILNNQGSVVFTNNSKLEGISLSAKTFVWVYTQSSYGNRNMLDTFPDIKGTGVLWTVPSTSQVHGNTPITRLVTKVQRISVNTLNFVIPLDTGYIITATVPDSSLIDFSGFQNMRGNLAFFAAWSTVLSDTQLNTVVSLLANRYSNSLAPYIFNTNTEFRNQLDISINLNNKVSDLQNLTLTYDLTTPIYDAAISPEGILTFTAERDEVLSFSIDVANSIPLTSTLEFDVDIAVRPNALYLTLKNLLGTALQQLFIAELDTLTLDGLSVSTWEDYRLNDYVANGTNVNLVSLPQLNNKYALDFDIDGESYLELPVSASGRCFGITYIRKENTSSRAFLVGQTSTAEFLSGVEGVLWDASTSPKILNEATYVNGIDVPNNYLITPIVLNTVLINTTDTITANSIAKDRLFNDRSVKGYIPVWFILNRTITQTEALLCDKYIRDYYDPSRFITLLHFDTSNMDSSVENKVLVTNGSLSTSIKKFGASSFILASSSTIKYIEIENESDYAYLNDDFTISCWLHINKTLDINDVLSVYGQTNLVMYIKGNSIYLGRNYVSDLALFNFTITSDLLNTFNHIAIVKHQNLLTLYINGNSIGSVSDNEEYTDYNTLIRIGQRTPIVTTGVNMYLDEFAIYKRGALHVENFLPPSAPYTTS